MATANTSGGKKPRILISTGRRNEATPSGEIQSHVIGCNVNYVSGVVRAGGAPLFAPRIGDLDAIDAMLDAADALLLTGGGDISAGEYGEEPHPKSTFQDPIRDLCERHLTLGALERGIPILGICRGIQMLNVVLGGTLIQDIPSQVENACLHYANPLHPTPIHTAHIEAGTLLSRIAEGMTTIGVNSYHHQSVGRLADGLRINCLAKDGIIEGVEAADGRPILALQWHPEEIAADYIEQQRFFNWLVEAAKR